MDQTSLLFVLLIVVVGGVIAYFGDWLGRRIGKKRLSMFGLRPRNTAALFTVLAGMVGTVFAVAAVSVLSRPVGVWLWQGSRVQASLEATKSDLRKTRSELETERGSVVEVREALAKESSKLKTAQGNVEKAQRDAASIRLEAKRLASEAKRLTSEVKQTRARLQETGRKLQAMQDRVQTLVAESKRLTTNNTTLGTQNRELASQNLDLANQVRENETKLREFDVRVAGLQTRIDELRKDLQLQQQLADQQAKNLDEQLRQARSELDSARAETEQARTEASTYLEVSRRYRESLGNSRFGKLLVNVRDELARVQVPPGNNQAEVRSRLLALISSAVDAAKQLGAGPPSGGDAAFVVQLQRPDGTMTTEAEVLDQVSQQAANKPDWTVIIARAVANAFRGEGIPLVFEVRDNPIVYRAGDLVSQLQLNAERPETDILAQISNFVETTLSADAVKAGMIPAVGRQEPLGRIDSQALLDLVPKIRATRGDVRLRFLASRETRAADRLELEFRVGR